MISLLSWRDDYWIGRGPATCSGSGCLADDIVIASRSTSRRRLLRWCWLAHSTGMIPCSLTRSTRGARFTPAVLLHHTLISIVETKQTNEDSPIVACARCQCCELSTIACVRRLLQLGHWVIGIQYTMLSQPRRRRFEDGLLQFHTPNPVDVTPSEVAALYGNGT